MKKSLFTAIEVGAPIGAGGSRLPRGDCEKHEALEAEAAQFFRSETALFALCDLRNASHRDLPLAPPLLA